MRTKIICFVMSLFYLSTDTRDLLAENALAVIKLKGHIERIKFISFSPDGTKFVTSSDDHIVRIWDAESGKYLRNLERCGGARDILSRALMVPEFGAAAAFSPDGEKIVTGGSSGTILIWDTESGRDILKISRPDTTGTICSVAFSPDGKKIITTGGDISAYIWDTDSGKELKKLDGHTSLIWSATFSPNGTKIVTASHDGTARIWDTDSGRELQKLEGHEVHSVGVLSAIFSQDGKRILTTTLCSVHLWDADTGRELHTQKGLEPSAIFAPDGKKILIGESDGTIRIFALDCLLQTAGRGL